MKENDSCPRCGNPLNIEEVDMPERGGISRSPLFCLFCGWAEDKP